MMRTCLLGAFAVSSVMGTGLPTAPPSVDACPVGFEVLYPNGGGNATGRSANPLTEFTASPSAAPAQCFCEVFGNETTKPFTDKNHTYCGHIPKSWEGAYHFSCPHCMEQGTSFNITCPNNWETCELLVNLYVCPGCSSSGAQVVNGLWPSSLAADGWTAAAACTSSFCTQNGRHQFTGFHKQIQASETEELPKLETDPTMYFSIIVMEGHVCGNLNDATQCANSPMCSWTGSACITDWCPKTAPGGRNPGCGACAPGAPEGDCSA
jgi:hypothetical protein